MRVGQIAVFAGLHRHATTRTRIAVTRNDPEEITLSLFLVHRFDSEMRAALTCLNTW